MARTFFIFFAALAVVAFTVAVPAEAVEDASYAPYARVTNVADESRPSPTPKPVRPAIQIRERVTEKREEFAGRRSELLLKECARVAENAGKLISKIQERIDRAKIAGLDVQAASNALANAKTNLETATSYCDQAAAKFDSVSSDETTEKRAVIAEARALARQAREGFTKVRKDLAEAIKLIRGLGVGKSEKTETREVN